MNTVKKAAKFIILLIIGLVAGIFIAGVISGAKGVLEGDKAEAIKTVLIKNCDCDSVDQFMYARGIQYSKKDGLSVEKAEYELVNCSYDNIDKEITRINKLLAEQVKGYDKLDLLKLEFVGADKRETFTIKNGIVQ